jgi:hypothetical protein
MFDVGAREQAAQAELAAEVKEWLEQHKLEEVAGAMLQMGVKTVEHLFMIDEQVSTECCFISTPSLSALLSSPHLYSQLCSTPAPTRSTR